MKEDRVRFPRVGTPEEDYIRVFGFAIGTGAATRAEGRRQTGDAGSMSSSVTTINVVGPHHGANELLGRIVQLVGGLGAAEHPKVSGIVAGDGFTECHSHAVHGFIPCGRAMGAILPYKRLGQAGFHWLIHLTDLHRVSNVGARNHLPVGGAGTLVAPGATGIVAAGGD